MSPTRDFVGGTPPRSGLCCALCGKPAALTKAHIPPQSAGNTGSAVTSARPFIQDGMWREEPPKQGGLWMKTICGPCNQLAGKYDADYKALAEALRPHARRHPMIVPTRNGVPPVTVTPGRVARSVLHGMVALAPTLKTTAPKLVQDLLDDRDNLLFPPGLRLRVALISDDYARIASEYHSYRVLQMRQDYEAFGEIYFRPMVWLLTYTATAFAASLPNQENWGDATDWITHDKSEPPVDLRDVLTALPRTVHPSRRRNSANEWIEFGTATSYVLIGQINFTKPTPKKKKRRSRTKH